MHALRTSVRTHPLGWYFSVTFLLSWGCIVLAVRATTGGLSPTPEEFQLTVPFTVPAMLLGGGTNGGIPMGIFLSLWFVGVLVGQLTAYRVLMVWVYDSTGSLLLAALMHASLSAFQFMLNPLTPGIPQQVYPWGHAATAWLVVAVVMLVRRGDLTRGPRTLSARKPIHHP